MVVTVITAETVKTIETSHKVLNGQKMDGNIHNSLKHL